MAPPAIKVPGYAALRCVDRARPDVPRRGLLVRTALGGAAMSAPRRVSVAPVAMASATSRSASQRMSSERAFVRSSSGMALAGVALSTFSSRVATGTSFVSEVAA